MLKQTQISKDPLPGGHGFAAEDSNNLNDQFRGKIASEDHASLSRAA